MKGDMPPTRNEKPALAFHPITPDRWPDLVRFFERHGNPNYCWCMRWRLSSSEFRRLKSADRKRALEGRVRAGMPIGILGYLGEEPIGWCSIAPRETYALLERSKTIKRIDNKTTWAVVCFFVAPKMRGRHFTVELLRAAVEYAHSHGAQVIEGYPVEPRVDADGNLQPATYRHMGYVSTFRKAGFREVVSPDKGRRIMRYSVSPGEARKHKS
jgi:GNAT superfamily N-acetyltransferase